MSNFNQQLLILLQQAVLLDYCCSTELLSMSSAASMTDKIHRAVEVLTVCCHAAFCSVPADGK
jgi:hypothetical protein